MGVSPQLVVGSAAEVDKLLETRCRSVAVVYDVGHVSSQDKRYSVPGYGVWGNGGMGVWEYGGYGGMGE